MDDVIIKRGDYRMQSCEYYGCNNMPEVEIGHPKIQFDNMFLCMEHARMLSQQLNHLLAETAGSPEAIMAEPNGKAAPAKKVAAEGVAWDDYDDKLDAMSERQLVSVKASKLQTYAKLRYDLTFRVGTTKVEMAAAIAKARGEK